jgi:hypothetical protein
LPWSMCPIVPMLRWGLLRSNFALAMSGGLLFPGPYWFSVNFSAIECGTSA